MAIIRHIICIDSFRAKRKKFLVLISPLYANSIQSHKGGCGFLMKAQAKGVEIFSFQVLFCKGKQNIKWKDTYNEKHRHRSDFFFPNVPKLNYFRWKDEVFVLDALPWNLEGLNFASSCTLFFPMHLHSHLNCIFSTWVLLGVTVRHRRGSLAGNPGM